MKANKIFASVILVMMATSILATAVPVADAATQPLFKITLVAPGSANLLRRQWGLIIANSFQTVGIDARVVFLGWGSVFDRILTPAPDKIGQTWDNGGFDALLIGWTPGSPSTPFLGTFQIYYSKNTPPGSNYFLWNNGTSDRLMESFMTKGYTAEGIAEYKRWQQVQFEDLPASQIFFTQAVLSADKALDFNDYEWIFDNIGPVPQFLEGKTEVVLGTTGELLDLNAPLSNSWYDTLVFNPVYDQLYFLNSRFEFEPSLATANPTVSSDGRNYTYSLRQGVLFHDGVEFTADDVVFSFLAYLNPQSGSQQSALEAGYIGEDITFKWLNGTSTRLVIDLASGVGYYPAPSDVSNPRKATIEAVDRYTVKISIADFGDLGKPVATFHPEGDTIYMLPKHVLETVPFSQWKEHPFNKGTGTYTANGQTFSGPMGTGPYVYKSYDAVRAIATLEKFNNYWNKTSLESRGLFGAQKYYVRYITEKDAAIAALKNGEVQIIDQNYQQQRDYQVGTLDFASNYILSASGLQQLGYNMRHPVFGTGVDTPLGRQTPSRAAEAARYVRQAMDYLIPRQLIIDNLLSGFGDPGSVHVNPLSPYYDTSIVAREYNPEKAKELLAMAGYEVGVTPSGTTGGPTAAAGYLLGEPLVFTGTFVVDTVASQEQGGFIVLLEKSSDNTTWTPVAQAVTTTGGYYILTYTPEQSGNYYFRVRLTGVGAKTAAASSYGDPTFPYDGLTLSVDPQIKPSVRVTVLTLDQALTSYRDQIASLGSDVDTYKDQVSSLNSQVTSLSAEVATLTTVAYASVAVAVIAIIIAVVIGMRRRE